jgi:hypothetical protein
MKGYGTHACFVPPATSHLSNVLVLVVPGKHFALSCPVHVESLLYHHILYLWDKHEVCCFRNISVPSLNHEINAIFNKKILLKSIILQQ